MKRSHKRSRYLADLRFAVCCAVLALLFLPVQRNYAQDVLPGCPRLQKTAFDCDTLRIYGQRTDTLPIPLITLPAAFRQLGGNELIDSIGILKPFWEKLRMLRLGIAADTVRIVHVGDSHIRGHIFPETTGGLLQRTFGALSYTDMGINGAFCTTFTRPDRVADIAALHPDLVILSFGTNESHNRRYNSILHYRQMEELMCMLRKSLPDVPMLMTTPPGHTIVSVSAVAGVPIRLIPVLLLPHRPSAVLPMPTDWRCGICTRLSAVSAGLVSTGRKRV